MDKKSFLRNFFLNFNFSEEALFKYKIFFLENLKEDFSQFFSYSLKKTQISHFHQHRSTQKQPDERETRRRPTRDPGEIQTRTWGSHPWYSTIWWSSRVRKRWRGARSQLFQTHGGTRFRSACRCGLKSVADSDFLKILKLKITISNSFIKKNRISRLNFSFEKKNFLISQK